MDGQAQRSAGRDVKSTLARARTFFTSRIWAVPTDGLRRRQRLLYRASRVLYTTANGYQQKQLPFRAAGLTYYSVLSVVPFLAFAFSVLKGFGGYTTLVEGHLRPYLRRTFGENGALLTGMENVLNFVEATDVSRLSTFGLLILAYTSINLLSTIEGALNDIWGAKSKRPFIRQVTDYTTLLVITPLLILVAATLGTAAESSGIVMFLRYTLALGPVIDFLLKFTSLVFVCMALFALYIIMPNVRTTVGSALLGATIGGLLWQGALLLHVRFQLGVASYNALYSALAALPIFLVWLYISWLVVLLGAQLAAAHQYEHTTRQSLRAQKVDQALREAMAVAIAAHVAHRFVSHAPRPTATELSDLLEAPPPTVESILDDLVCAGLLARTVGTRELGYLPARDLDEVRVSHVREAIRSDPEAAELKATLDARLGPQMDTVLKALDQALVGSPHDVSMRTLATYIAPEAPPVSTDAQLDVKEPVLDAKQPEVPT